MVLSPVVSEDLITHGQLAVICTAFTTGTDSAVPDHLMHYATPCVHRRTSRPWLTSRASCAAS